MKYAVFQTGGKQYKATVGSILEIEKLQGVADDAIKFDKVLMSADAGTYDIGTPYLDNALITAKILEQKKGKKLRVAKFKAKSRYRRVTGHRQHLTRVEIVSIATKDKTKADKSIK